ncbi:MAG TPA: SGNH/GDSL hydrolase family protein [Acidobacteriaceae bacterium]|nr:SGNH/GDSL hydrolase family protein [Acidobacteriaceae bacterium]
MLSATSTRGARTERFSGSKALWAGRLAVMSLFCVLPATGRPAPYGQWCGTWATAAMQGNSQTTFTNETLRQIVHTSVGGARVRIRISNLFGTEPLRVEDLHLALWSCHSSIVAGSDRRLAFGGSTAVVIPPGKAAISDPIQYDLPALTDVAISFYLPRTTGDITFHPSAHQTSYIATSDVSGNADFSDGRKITSNYFLTNVEVQGKHLSGSLVTLGASITEGYKATDGANRQWPSVLARRLVDAGLKIGVLNEGISGNRLLAAGAGASALSRFQRDVLDQPGVRWVIFSDDPINDLGSTKPPPTGGELIAATKHLIAEAHQQHILFFCSTLTPFEGANYWTPKEEIAREQFNAFVRSMNSGCDAVIDQDRATHDPEHPKRFLSAYDSGDHLHPNDAGHRAIADAVNLPIFLDKRGGAGTENGAKPVSNLHTQSMFRRPPAVSAVPGGMRHCAISS